MPLVRAYEGNVVEAASRRRANPLDGGPGGSSAPQGGELSLHRAPLAVTVRGPLIKRLFGAPRPIPGTRQSAFDPGQFTHGPQGDSIRLLVFTDQVESIRLLAREDGNTVSYIEYDSFGNVTRGYPAGFVVSAGLCLRAERSVHGFCAFRLSGLRPGGRAVYGQRSDPRRARRRGSVRLLRGRPGKRHRSLRLVDRFGFDSGFGRSDQRSDRPVMGAREIASPVGGIEGALSPIGGSCA